MYYFEFSLVTYTRSLWTAQRHLSFCWTGSKSADLTVIQLQALRHIFQNTLPLAELLLLLLPKATLKEKTLWNKTISISDTWLPWTGLWMGCKEETFCFRSLPWSSFVQRFFFLCTFFLSVFDLCPFVSNFLNKKEWSEKVTFLFF